MLTRPRNAASDQGRPRHEEVSTQSHSLFRLVQPRGRPGSGIEGRPPACKQHHSPVARARSGLSGERRAGPARASQAPQCRHALATRDGGRRRPRGAPDKGAGRSIQRFWIKCPHPRWAMGPSPIRGPVLVTLSISTATKSPQEVAISPSAGQRSLLSSAEPLGGAPSRTVCARSAPRRDPRRSCPRGGRTTDHRSLSRGCFLSHASASASFQL
jgi:hypothetical protein